MTSYTDGHRLGGEILQAEKERWFFDMLLEISDEELKRRRTALLKELNERGVKAYIIFSATDIFYLTRFAFIPTERPAALVLTASDQAILFVPRLEEEHAEEGARVDRVRSYPEYPSTRHPLEYLKDLLEELGLVRGPLGVDADGYASPMGYRGPRLSQLMPAVEVTVLRGLVEKLRMIKAAEEVTLIRESARWGNLAHTLLQEYARAGLTELEISPRASMEATLIMMRTLGKNYRPVAFGGVGASAGFRGQIGPNSALPHAVTTNARLKPGDVLVTGAGARVGGYGSELERTMFVGEPTPKQRWFFEKMMGAQEVAFAAIKPGRKCSEVDREVLRYYEEEGLMEYWRHHTGHALGLLGHEAPFFDQGDETVIEPGMVFSVEPGLYVPGLGGFRHSDTILVTSTGIELITYYPRDLESLIVPDK